MNFRFDEFNAERRTLLRGGSVIALNSKALESVAVLVGRRGETRSKHAPIQKLDEAFLEIPKRIGF